MLQPIVITDEAVIRLLNEAMDESGMSLNALILARLGKSSDVESQEAADPDGLHPSARALLNMSEYLSRILGEHPPVEPAALDDFGTYLEYEVRGQDVPDSAG